MANQTSCLIIQVGSGSGIPIVREIDGTPIFTDIDILEVPNGTLSQPSAGIARISSLITPSDHEVLDTLVHDIAETAFRELLYTGSNLTSATYWTTPGKTLKIREATFTYVANKVATTTVVQYDGAGAVVSTLTSTFTYLGGKLVSVSVVKT